MGNVLSRLKDMFVKNEDEEFEQAEEYIELAEHGKDNHTKVVVHPFTMEDFEDIKDILKVLREGYTIALIDIRPLKDKDIVELKRAINKLKKTCDAIEGDLAGFGDNYIVAVPNFALIHRRNNQEEFVTDDE